LLTPTDIIYGASPRDFLEEFINAQSNYTILPRRVGEHILITSTKTLPEGYAQSGEIILKTNKRLAITLNIVAFFVAVLSFFLLSSFVALVRPRIMILSGSITTGVVIVLTVLVVILLTIHELIHGFFFWVFTHSRPVFAIRLLYAYAGAPAWYIPIRHYAFVTVGPLVILDAVGLLLMLLVPESWVLIIAFVTAFTTGGAMGDLLVFTRLVKLSPRCLVNDTGDVVTFYEHPSNISHI
jgi:hypothetical protein